MLFKVNSHYKICACYLKQTVIIPKENIGFMTLMEISYTTSNKEA